MSIKSIEEPQLEDVVEGGKDKDNDKDKDKDLYQDESEEEEVKFDILECKDYNTYLDSHLLVQDLRFMHNRRNGRELVKLGYRGDIMSPEQYETNRIKLTEALYPRKQSTIFFSDMMTSTDPVLVELAQREKLNYQKIIATIIFVKRRLKNGFVISGYIDFEQSLRLTNMRAPNCVDWMGVFQERVKLRPSVTDLSYCNWYKHNVAYNDSDNWQLIHDLEDGLVFMHKGDHKKICPDFTKRRYRNNYSRYMHFSEKLGYIVIYDHIIRKKV